MKNFFNSLSSLFSPFIAVYDGKHCGDYYKPSVPDIPRSFFSTDVLYEKSKKICAG